jgi:predicted outer membrane repeat protein
VLREFLHWDEDYVELLAVEDEVSLPGTATFSITADTPGVPDIELTAVRWDNDASRLYVSDDAPPPGDGLSWTTAYTDLQDALAHAAGVSGVVSEIRVGQGTYRPDRSTGDRAATFQLISGVGLYGGYRGIDPNDPGDPNDHDPNTFQSTLSGDLLRNDGPPFVEEFTMCYSGEGTSAEPGCEAFDLDGDTDVDQADLELILAGGNYDDNSVHVVTGSGTDATAVLDGFTITAGYADLPHPHDRGGGLHNGSAPAGSPTVVNCKFMGNYACYGGGISNECGSRPMVIDSLFQGNLAWEGNGAGIDNNYRTRCTVVACVFQGNTAAYCGGGISSGGCNPQVIDCTFVRNVALSLDPNWEQDGGGAIFHWSTTNVIRVHYCIFADNMAFDGCGGAVNNRYADRPEFVNCAFYGNSATEAGAGIFLWCSGAVVNCIFAGNAAGTDGGGLFYRAGSSVVQNCTFSGNVAGGEGGGIYVAGQPRIANTILWGNTPENVGGYGADAVIEYCDVGGGWPGTGNIDANPVFVDPDGPDNDPNTLADNDYRLSTGSPCVDAGCNWAVPRDTADLDGDGDTDEITPLDLDGEGRFFDDPNTPDTGCGWPPIVDMGAYEFGGTGPQPCFGDLDNDRDVDLADLATLLSHYGESDVCLGDLDCDGDVDLDDLVALLGVYGTTCP